METHRCDVVDSPCRDSPMDVKSALVSACCLGRGATTGGLTQPAGGLCRAVAVLRLSKLQYLLCVGRMGGTRLSVRACGGKSVDCQDDLGPAFGLLAPGQR